MSSWPEPDNERLLTQVGGLSELTPGPLSHTKHEIMQLVLLSKSNIIIGESRIIPGERGYFTARRIGEGELVFSVFGTIIGYQTPRHSIQIGYGVHIDTHEYGGRHINHHCDGNLTILWDNRGLHKLVAARELAEGEEISYPYWRTELCWSADASESSVRCSCGSSKCKGRILSFRDLSSEDREQAFKEGGIAWYLYLERRTRG